MLFNQSNGLLRYVIEMEDAEGHRTPALAPPGDYQLGPFSSMGGPLALGPEFSVSAPTGVLPARAHVAIEIIFQPHSRKLYNMSAVCRIAGASDARLGANMMYSSQSTGLPEVRGPCITCIITDK